MMVSLSLIPHLSTAEKYDGVTCSRWSNLQLPEWENNGNSTSEYITKCVGVLARECSRLLVYWYEITLKAHIIVYFDMGFNC